MDAYKALITELDRYIKKHHKNQLIKGLIYALALGLALFLLVISLEYFGAFSKVIRTLLVAIFVAGSVYILIRFVFIPVSKLLNIRRGISKKEAAKIIGNHFPSVSDKLTNIIELQELSETESYEVQTLIQAGITQKAEELKPVPFLSAINFRDNLKYVKYAAIPTLILVASLIIFPDFVKQPSKRLMSLNQEFIPSAPFNLNFNKSYSVIEGEDFTFKIEVAHSNLSPSSVEINFGAYTERLSKTGPSTFIKQFSNIRSDLSFTVKSEGFDFGNVEVIVLKKPVITGFVMELNYPKHYDKPSEVIDGSGDAVVPFGTSIKWIIKAENTDTLALLGVPKVKSQIEEELTLFNWIATKSLQYGINRGNKHIEIKDSATYGIQVVKDAYPTISGNFQTENLISETVYLTGDISDDVGFKDLTLYYRSSSNPDWQTRHLEISKRNKTQEFFEKLNKSQLGLSLGDSVEYYFQVRDNDYLNGFKASKTATKTFKINSKTDLANNRDQGIESAKQSLEELIKKSNSLSEEIKKTSKELMQKKRVDLNDKKKLEELIKQREELQNKIQELARKNEETEMLQKNLNPEQERLNQQQEKINELIEKANNPELDKLMEEIQELMQGMDQDEILKKLEQYQQENESLTEELDRSLELMKKFAHELKLQETADKLKELAKEQKKESESNDNTSEAEENQREINEQFKELSEKLEDLKKESEELKTNEDLEEEISDSQELEEQLEEISEELEKQNQNSPSSSPDSKTKNKQQDAGKKMEQLASDIEASMSSAASQENQENIEDLKQILENLITLSKDQEDIYNQFGEITSVDPKYRENAIKQASALENFKIIEDSLNALAKRVIQIEGIVRKEINTINTKMKSSISELGERVTSRARMHQRYSLTSINNLALLLNEVLDQLENQQAQSNPGMANCNKPGAGKSKPSMQKMRKAQEQFAKKMEEMLKKGKGKEKGEGEKGKQPQDGKGGEGPGSEELVKMAAQQSAIRKKLRELAKELNKDGSGAGNELNKIAKELEEIEKDLFYNKVNPETLLRQQEIIVKMLEEENAERTQELDNKREGKQSEQLFRDNPDFLEYLEKRRKTIENLQSLPESLRKYYMDKSKEYLNQVKP